MSKKKKKIYVIWEGVETGIFHTWNECLANTKGYPKAKFKSFLTLEAAEKAFSESYWDYAGKDVKEKFTPELSKEQLLLIGQPISDSISVDAACSGNPGRLEYQGVITETKEVIFKQGPFEYSTVNMGEFLAIVHALAELKRRNDKRPIYSDSTIAMGWVKKGICNTNLEETENNKETFKLITRALKWLSENTYDNQILKWETKAWGEIPADYGRKK
ncbi:viroplasmin family protein [Gillisia sp. Hel_I_29]|uniref:ribonuclease H1 domain-containing protein n=1 Tax=Gillisia sp. Hel_I_29 TaxID=1249975 RepID=UPI00055224C3|nr:ribonuclease H family protein [Gillisia sp. Hel_I_29]